MTRASEIGRVSAFKKVAKCSQRSNTVADDLRNRQHGYREDRARNTPHPEPEDERDDDADGIEGESSGQNHLVLSSRPQSNEFRGKAPPEAALARLHQVDAIFAIFGAFDRDKRLILKSRG